MIKNKHQIAANKINWKYAYFGIFLIPLIINPFSIQPFEIPKVSWMMLFVALYLVLGIPVLIKGRKKIPYNKYVYSVIGLWAAVYIVATIFSASPVESFWGSFERMQGTLIIFYYLAHFLICLKFLRREKEQNILLHLVIILGSLISIYALIQWFRVDPFPIGDIDKAGGRAYGTLGQPNLLGQFLLAPIFASLILFFNSWKPLKYRLVYLLAFLLSLAGLLVTFNRASLLGLLVAALLLFIYERKLKASRQIIVFGTILGLIIAGMILFGGTLRSLNSRAILWENSLPLISQNWIIGSGPETFYQSFQTVLTPDLYLSETLYNMPDRVHNEALQTFLDLGVLGFLLYLFNLIFLCWVYFKHKAETAGAKVWLFVLIATTISLQFGFATSTHLVFLLAFWAILVRSTVKFRIIKLKINIPARILTILVMVLIALFTINHSYSINRANTLMSQGINEFFVDYKVAAQTFDQMLKTAPHYRHLHYSVIHFLSLKDQLNANPAVQEQVKKELEELRVITNDGFHYRIVAAKIASNLGNWEQAREHYAEAAKKAPNFPLIYQDWGDSAFQNSDFKEAIKQYEKLKDLAPYFWVMPDPDIADPRYMEQHRIFAKTHTLFYGAMSKLSISYRMEGENDKAWDLEQKAFLKGGVF